VSYISWQRGLIHFSDKRAPSACRVEEVRLKTVERPHAERSRRPCRRARPPAHAFHAHFHSSFVGPLPLKKPMAE